MNYYIKEERKLREILREHTRKNTPQKKEKGQV
jgi:hypothetical protein